MINTTMLITETFLQLFLRLARTPALQESQEQQSWSCSLLHLEQSRLLPTRPPPEFQNVSFAQTQPHSVGGLQQPDYITKPCKTVYMLHKSEGIHFGTICAPSVELSYKLSPLIKTEYNPLKQIGFYIKSCQFGSLFLQNLFLQRFFMVVALIFNIYIIKWEIL